MTNSTFTRVNLINFTTKKSNLKHHTTAASLAIISLCLFLLFSCQPTEKAPLETVHASTVLENERIDKLQKLWITTNAAILASAQHYHQVKTAVGKHPSAKIDVFLKQIDSALRTQNKILQKWQGKLKAAEQYAKINEEHEVVLKTHQEMTKALREVNKIQQAIETDLAYIESK